MVMMMMTKSEMHARVSENFFCRSNKNSESESNRQKRRLAQDRMRTSLDDALPYSAPSLSISSV